MCYKLFNRCSLHKITFINKPILWLRLSISLLILCSLSPKLHFYFYLVFFNQSLLKQYVTPKIKVSVPFLLRVGKDSSLEAFRLSWELTEIILRIHCDCWSCRSVLLFLWFILNKRSVSDLPACRLLCLGPPSSSLSLTPPFNTTNSPRAWLYIW